MVCLTPQLIPISSDSCGSVARSDTYSPESKQDYGWSKGITEWNADMFARRKPREHDYPFSSPFSQGSGQRSSRHPPLTSLSTITEHSTESHSISLTTANNLLGTGKLLHSYPLPSLDYDSNYDEGAASYADLPKAPPTMQSAKNTFRARLLAASSNTAWSQNNAKKGPFE